MLYFVFESVLKNSEWIFQRNHWKVVEFTSGCIILIILQQSIKQAKESFKGWMKE